MAKSELTVKLEISDLYQVQEMIKHLSMSLKLIHLIWDDSMASDHQAKDLYDELKTYSSYHE